MSYTRSYNAIVQVITNVDYPASERGGSKPVRVEEPIQINVTVDTTPFDTGIASMHNEVIGLGSNINSASLKQVEEKEKAAKNISDATIRGVRNLISSEVNQQFDEIKSRVQSNLALITREKQEAYKQKKSFLDNYNMIKKRYYELFSSLDKELHSRIKELNKPAFDLIQKDYQENLAQKYMKLPGRFFGFNLHNDSAIESIVNISVIHDIQSMVKEISRFVGNQNQHKKDILSILLDRRLDEISDISIPVILIRADDESVDNHVNPEMNAFISDEPIVEESLPGKFLDKIKQKENDLNWNDNQKENLSEKDNIDIYFNRLINLNTATENDERRQRVLATMQKLWNKTSFKTL